MKLKYFSTKKNVATYGSAVGLNLFHICYCHGPLTRYVNCGLRMRRECREHSSRHQPQRKPLASDPGMHHSTCVTHPLSRGGGESACPTRSFTYLVRGPFTISYSAEQWNNGSQRFEHFLRGYLLVANSFIKPWIFTRLVPIRTFWNI